MHGSTNRFVAGEVESLRARALQLLARKPAAVHQLVLQQVLRELEQIPWAFAESYQWQALAGQASRLRELERVAFARPHAVEHDDAPVHALRCESMLAAHAGTAKPPC
jgi:hypothetical protein